MLTVAPPAPPAVVSSTRPVRRSREEARAETRLRLVAAAEHVLLRDGLAGASLGAIATHAGYTTGAVYSNFSGKDELFLAVYDRRVAAVAGALQDALTGADDLDGLLERVAAWFESMVVENHEWAALSLEATVRARHVEPLRRAMASRDRAVRAALASILEEQAARFGAVLPNPAAQTATAVVALGHGLVADRFLDPTSPAPQVLGAALRTLLGLTPSRSTT